MSYKRKTSIATLALVCALAVAPKSWAASRLVSAELYPNCSITALTSAGLAEKVVFLSQAEPLSESLQGRSVESVSNTTDPTGLVAALSSGQFLLWLLILLPIAVLIGFLVWSKRDRYSRSAQAKTEGLGQSLQPETTPDLASTTLSQMSKDTTEAEALHELAKTSVSSDTKIEETSTLISPELSAKTFDSQTASERVSESPVVETQEISQVEEIELEDEETVSESSVVETQEISQVADIGDEDEDEVSERDGEADENLKQATLTGGQAWVVGEGDDRSQLDVESKKFSVGQHDDSEIIGLDVDEGLADLPGGYGQKRIVLLPRDPNWAYAYWDIANEYREPLRQKGGKQLALRVYDVTWIDMDKQRPHSMKQYECDELTQEWYIPVPMSDRDYIVEIGYVTESGHWLVLARSESVHIPPVYPCDHYGDRFYTISWEENLRGKNI